MKGLSRASNTVTDEWKGTFARPFWSEREAPENRRNILDKGELSGVSIFYGQPLFTGHKAVSKTKPLLLCGAFLLMDGTGTEGEDIQ